MGATVLSIEAAKGANINLTEGDKGHQALHETIVAYRANRRSGTACTKRRGEVAGSGKKLWKQKGTGNARMGSRRSPIWSGGGIAWGPRPRDYYKKTNRKVRKLAFRAAITSRINDGDVLVIDGFNVADGKTKSFVSAITNLCEANKILLIANLDETTLRSARNVQNVQIVRPQDVTAEHVLNYKKLMITQDALQVVSQRTVTE